MWLCLSQRCLTNLSGSSIESHWSTLLILPSLEKSVGYLNIFVQLALGNECDFCWRAYGEVLLTPPAMLYPRDELALGKE